MTSSFVYAGFFSDHIQTNTVPAPSVPSDGKLLSEDELNTEFNEEYYNDNHLVEDETEAGEFFDEKADFHTTDDLSGLPNSSKSTNDELRSPASNIANSTKTKEYIMRDDSQPQEYGIMPIADIDDYNFVPPFITKFTTNHNRHFVIDNPNNLVDVLKGKFGSQYDISYSLYHHSSLSYISGLFPDYDNFLNLDFINTNNLLVFKHTAEFSSTCYGFIFSDSDIRFKSDSDYNRIFFDSLQSNYFAGMCYGGYFSNNEFVGYSILNMYISIPGYNRQFSSSLIDFEPVFIGKNIDVYIDDEKQEKYNEDGTLIGDIYGEFGFKEDSKILTYKAWSDKELDKTYDVHLWAMDSPSVPAKINGNEDFPIRDLDNYDSHGLQLSASKSSVQASYELEAVYYYLHQMQGYDDSLESVDGYEFEKFESRENLSFAIAYREKGSAGDWIVCKSYQYNYGDLIENVMGSFTVKKDYVDFPDMDDYLEDYESWEDVALDETGGEGGFYNNVVVLFKWVGRNLMHFGHNFVGFFKWLIDCIPVLWENLTIALYNLVCDLKELALYFVNPKTKSIYAMTCERIPSFSLLVDSFKNNNSSTLPSFTFFGTKFSLNFSDYDIDFSFIRNISTILFYLLFGYFVFKLIFKIFGFGSGGGDED